MKKAEKQTELEEKQVSIVIWGEKTVVQQWRG